MVSRRCLLSRLEYAGRSADCGKRSLYSADVSDSFSQGMPAASTPALAKSNQLHVPLFVQWYTP